MTSQETRRRYLSGLAIATTATLGGCVGNAAENDDSGTDGSSDESTPDSERQPSSDDEPGSPEETLRRYVGASVEADDPSTVGAYFHPVHPFHPDDRTTQDAREWLLRDEPVSEVETETVDRDVALETICSAPVLQAAGVERDALVDALEDEQTAVVDVSVTAESGETTEFSAVTVTVDGEWRILAQEIEPSYGTTEPGPFAARVVEDVTFDTETDSARVHFVDSPVADSVTAAAETATSARSSSTPEAINYFDLSLAADGDEVVVTATVDGETRPVHRERYPPSARAVDAVTVTERPDDALFDATARVEFTGEQMGDEITIASTIEGDEASIEPAGRATHLTVGIEPAGDEVVVTLTDDGEREEIHRERYRPSAAKPAGLRREAV